jgi:predicted kinase
MQPPPTSRPRILAVTGPPCSGKSSLAEQISQRHGFRLLQMDHIRSVLIPGSHTIEDRDIAYRAMHLLAEHLVAADQSVILDATYLRVEHRRALEDLAQRLELAVYLLECRIAPALAIERFRSRSSHPAMDLTPARVGEIAASFPYCGSGLTLDTSIALAECLARVARYLNDGAPLRRDGEWSA